MRRWGMRRWLLLAVLAGLGVLWPVAESCWGLDEFPFHARWPSCGAETSGYGGAR